MSRPFGLWDQSDQSGSYLTTSSNQPQETTGIQWLSYGSMPYNTAVPFFIEVSATPDYFANTTDKVSTVRFYWANRLIAGLADAHAAVMSETWMIIGREDMAGAEMIGRVDRRPS